MADVEITTFREEQVTEIDGAGRVVRQKGRLTPKGGAPPPSSSALSQAILGRLNASRHDTLRGAGGGTIAVTVGRVREVRPSYPAVKEAGRLARELAGFK